MTTIEQLENELNESLNAQYLLRERLESSMKTLHGVENLLKVVNTNLRHSNQYIHALEQENGNLKASCNEWMKRSINLEFEVLNARGATQK